VSTPKGYPSQAKLDRLSSEFSTVEPVREGQHGLSVLAHQTVFEVGTATTAAGCTKAIVITAAAHGARKGDVISIESGALSPQQVKVHSVTSATELVLAEDLSAALAAGVSLKVLRHVYPLVNADGTAIVSVAELAVAPVGDPLPAEVKVIGGYDGAAVRAIKTDGTGEAIAQVSNLPTDYATEITLQAAQSNLAAIESYTSSIDTKIMNDWNSSPAAILTASLLGNESGLVDFNAGNASAQTIRTVIATDQAAIPASQSGTWNINNIAGTVSLPTGAATETTLQAIDTKLGSPLAVTQSGTWDINNISGTISLPTGAATEATLAAIQVDTGNIVGDTNTLVTNTGNIQLDTAQIATNTTNISSDTSGIAGSALSIDGKLANDFGVSTGALRVASQLGNAAGAADFNAGNAGAQTLRVVVASDQAAIKTVPGLDVVDFIDTTPVLDASVTNIPASASNPLEIVASLAASVKAIKVNDTIGEYIGVYTGAALSEVLQCVVGPGEDGIIPVVMNSAERVSLRNMANAALSTGKISIQFLG